MLFPHEAILGFASALVDAFLDHSWPTATGDEEMHSFVLRKSWSLRIPHVEKLHFNWSCDKQQVLSFAKQNVIIHVKFGLQKVEWNHLVNVSLSFSLLLRCMNNDPKLWYFWGCIKISFYPDPKKYSWKSLNNILYAIWFFKSLFFKVL